MNSPILSQILRTTGGARQRSAPLIGAGGPVRASGSGGRGITSAYSRAEAQRALAGALAAAGQFERSAAVAGEITDAWRRTAAQRDLAAALAQAGRFGRALRTLGGQDIEAFVQFLASWGQGLKAVYPHPTEVLLVAILCQALRILCWERPDWQPVYEALQDDNGTTGEN